MNDATTKSDQHQIMQRLQAMGISAKLVPGGRCVLASMHATRRCIETLSGSLPLAEIVFATVGRDQIKCLRPSALFVLPLIGIADCKNAASLEGRVRASFSEHMQVLRSAESWLRELGADVSAARNGTMLRVSIAGEGLPVKLHVCKPHELILPSRGPLSGLTLARAEDRSMSVDPSIDSAIDLEIDVSTRFDQLSRMDSRLKEGERRKAMSSRLTVSRPAAEPAAERPRRILLVGQRLASERACVDSLRLRDYEVEIAHGLNEAIEVYDRTSPELVIADVRLGRFDGIELIPSLRSVVGVEEIPVILVDSQHRTARRDAAQRAGAIGYLTYPIDVSGIANRLEQIFEHPKRRRFSRYSQQLSVKLDSSRAPSTLLALGRGGMMIRNHDDLPPGSVQRCDLSLPALGKHLQFDAEVLYQVPGPGIGLRFQSLTPDDEASLIGHLRCLP